MKAMNGFVVACCIVIAAVAVLLLVSTPVQADSKYLDYWASSSYGVNNNGGGGGPYDELTAVDLHFSLSVSNKNKDNITSYSIGVTPDPHGIKTIVEHHQGTRLVALDISYTGISIPHTGGVYVTGKLAINSLDTCVNALINYGFKWSYQGGLLVVPGAPDHRFDFPDAVYAGPIHSAVYNYYNYDSSVTITLTDLSFYQDSVWIEPDSQWSPGVLSNPFHQEPGPFVLQPGDSISIALGDLPNLPHSYIYVAGEMGYQMPDFDSSVVGFRHGHEELRQGEAAIPTLTEWGLIIFGVVLLGFITWVFLRRRRPVVSVQ
jgi:hypothetical protein